MALPFLEAMLPKAMAAASSKAPVRMAFLYVPNGMNMREWTPAQTGADFELPFILDPLKHVLRRKELQGVEVGYYEIPSEGRHIWGATAGMLVGLYQRLSNVD